MTGRERILTALERKQPDRIPTMEWVISSKVIKGITGYTSDVDFVCEYGVDGIAVPLQYRKVTVDNEHFKDEWGIVRRSNDEYPTPVEYPIGSEEDLTNYVTPDPDDEFRFTEILKVQKEIGKEKAVVPRVKDVFSMPRDLMGFENFLMGFYLDPQLVQDLIEMSVEHSIKIAKNLKSMGIEVIVVGDDIANNTGLLLSPKMYSELVYPHFKKLIGEFKKIGLKVIKHTDGDLSAVLDELVNSGIDCLDPIDPLGNMDMGYMKQTYGDKIALKGNVDCVHTLVDGTFEEVERDVKKCILQGGIGGGHIISSSNTIHVGINPQNYKFFLECVKKYGRYPLDIDELKGEFNEKFYHLAFDLGAESGRAVVGELCHGKMIMQEINRFETGIIKINGNTYCAVINCYKEILNSLKIFKTNFGNELVSVGVDSWGCDYGLLDHKDRLVSIPYSYRDSRVNGTDDIIEEKISSKRLYQLTGIQMLPINTLNQIIGMINKQDETINISESMLFVGDLMHFFLTGRVATEHTMLSISQLYNNMKKDYEDEVFECFGINKKIKTDVIYAGDLYGLMRKEISDKIGINQAKVITPAVHDTASGFAAVPAKEGENWYTLSSGTWSILGTELDNIIINEETYQFNISNSAGVLGKNLLLKNVMGLWIIQQCKKEWNKINHNLTYSDIVSMAKDAMPFYGYIEPDDFMFFNPDNMTETISMYLKISGQREVLTTDIGQISRIVYESLAMKYRYVLDKIEKAAGKKADVMYFIGGGIKNEMLNRFTANATEKRCVTGSSESCTMGNLLMQCYGCNMLSSLEEIRKVARNSLKDKCYEPAERDEWNREYKRFLLVTNLK